MSEGKAYPAARTLLPAILLLTALGSAQASSAERTLEVKAAFVLNIARFVYWPEEHFAAHPAEIHLCLYRGNPLGEALASIRHKQVAGRTLIIHRTERIGALPHCNILLVPPEQLARFREDPDRSPDHPLLTITDDTDGNTDTEGIQITLVRRGTRIGFDIDLKRVKQAGLRLSSELLKLGRIVRTTREY